MFRSLVFIVSAFMLASAPIVSAQESRPANLVASVPTFPNVNCPIMGKPTSTSLFVDTPMGRIYTCCAPCNARIRKDPVTSHKAAYPKITRLENRLCPITGKPIPADAPRVVLQGYEFSVCSKDCVPKVSEESQVVLTKVVYPTVRDIGNTNCPLTGKTVEKNAFVLIGDDLVHLSSSRCFEVVASAPEEMLRKAKALVPATGQQGADTKPAKSNQER